MESIIAFVGIGFGTVVSLIVLLFVLWSVFWKGWALWVASKENSKLWFFVLLIVNTFGILEIIYIFMFSKNRKDNSPYKDFYSKKGKVSQEETPENIGESEVENEEASNSEVTSKEPNA